MKIPPFKLERYFAQHEFSVRHVLCASDCESLSLGELCSYEPGAREALEKIWLGYTESLGHPELRREIAGLYANQSAENVLTHVGAEEAIFNFMNVTLEKGDHIIVHTPCYQSLFQIAESIGCRVTKWNADPRNNWELDLDFLKKSLKKNTKVVVINLPHNPTGHLMSRDKFDEVVRLVKKNGSILFSDEVYRGLEYDSNTALPSACDVYEKAVSLGVMSKAFGLAGLRIGWVTSKHQKTLAAMAQYKDYTTICSSAPSEYLSILGLKHRKRIVERNRAIIAENIQLLDGFFARHAEKLSWNRPAAGCIAFPKMKKGTADAFCAKLLKETNVLLAPGSNFGMANHFRIGFGRKNFRDGLSQVEKFF